MTAPLLLEEDQSDGSLGPAMRLLPTAKMRRFVEAVFEVPAGRHATITAAKMAGYGSPQSSNSSLSVMACRLLADDRIQAALLEYSRVRLRALAPIALVALENLLRDRKHPGHPRAVMGLLDKLAPSEFTQTVQVNHNHQHRVIATAEVLERIRQLAVRAGLDPAGHARVIEGQVIEDVT